MSHFGTSKTAVKNTPSEWLKVGSQVGQLVNKWAERNDLVVYVGEVMSAPAPALFDPRTAEIEVNTKVAFGLTEPELIGDLNDREMMFEFPRATGAILHEALHARFTQWDLMKSNEDLTRGQNEALHLLEEGRIEAMGVLTFPKNKVFLRACAMEIVIADLNPDDLGLHSTTRACAKIAGLVGARIDAGVLELSDVADVIDLVKFNLGEELYGQLRTIWRKAQNYTIHNNAEPLYQLAIEWDKLVEDKAKENGEGEGEGEGGEGGCGFPMPQEMIDKIKEALENGAEETDFQVVVEIGDQQQDERWENEVKEKSNDSKRRDENKKEANKTFAKNSGAGETSSSSKLSEVRKPTSVERVASVKVAQMLEKAKYRERDVTIVRSVLPQGRLKSRALVQAQALKSKGIHTQVEAWEHKTRKHTDEPTLSIGVMVDISGSMGGAMTPMAITAWVLANAGRRIQASTAMVYFGSGVFPTLRKGEPLDEVRVYTAPDGTEKFDQAFRAIDGHLNLLDGKGARLLVIVSDGHYSGSEPTNAKKWIAECDRLGVAVLWLTFDNSTSQVENYFGAGSSAHAGSLSGKSVEQSAILIGEAGAKALESVGKRNAY
jgi:hypothetical protein